MTPTIPTTPAGTRIVALGKPSSSLPKRFQVLAFLRLDTDDTRIVDIRPNPIEFDFLPTEMACLKAAVEDARLGVSEVDAYTTSAAQAMRWAKVFTVPLHDEVVIIQFIESPRTKPTKPLDIETSALLLQMFGDHLRI